MSWTVYKHTGPSGKVYIGITGRKPEKRWDNGKGYKHCPHMSAAIEKYGWDNFAHDILLTGLTKEEAEAAEIEYIALYKSNDRRHGYNTDRGGYAPGRMSEETREKLAEHMRGSKNPTVRFGHPFLGKHHSDESKARMSEAAKRRTGQPVSPETREKLRQRAKTRAVVDISTGIVYAGIHEAAEAVGANPTKICAVCKGKRKTTAGRAWACAEITKEETKP